MIALILALLVAACGGGTSPATTSTSGSESAAPDHRVILRGLGGLCPTDEGSGVCEDVVTIEQDGWTAIGTPPPSPTAGAIDPATFERIVATLEGGFDALTAEPFTGTCPTAYEGQEITIELWTLPNDPLADANVRTTSSCTHDWETITARDVLDQFREHLRRAGIPF